MFTHWASKKESCSPIDLVLTTFGSRGPRGVRIGCVEGVDVCVSMSSFRDEKLFWGEIKLVQEVFTGDLDLDCVRFLRCALRE